uniref:FHA domain-containing protein n=1 Tax=Aegilops tauschii subsp. strangulata TaxID=200361 RepID=A0A453BM82_AEGTS
LVLLLLLRTEISCPATASTPRARRVTITSYRRRRSPPQTSLQSYDVDSAVAVIQDGSARLKIDTQNLRDISFRSNSTFQFIGELLIQPNNDAILQARVGRNVDGLDLNLYQQSLIIRRQHEAKLLSSRRP